MIMLVGSDPRVLPIGQVIWYQGMYQEGEQAQIGLRLPGSGLETPSKPSGSGL